MQTDTGEPQPVREPLGTAALITAVSGLVAVLFRRSKAAATAAAILVFAGAGLLLALMIKLSSDVTREGQGLLQVRYEPGFWIAIALLLAAGILNAMPPPGRDVRVQADSGPSPPPPGRPDRL
ncbi:MAG: hypothetical protein ABJA81_02780 [Nocardioidaceae bacterium]